MGQLHSSSTFCRTSVNWDTVICDVVYLVFIAGLQDRTFGYVDLSLLRSALSERALKEAYSIIILLLRG